MSSKIKFSLQDDSRGTFLMFPSVLVRLVWAGQGFGNYQGGRFALQHSGSEPLVELYTDDYPVPPFELCFHVRFTTSGFLKVADKGEGIEIGVECLNHAVIPAEVVKSVACEVRRLVTPDRTALSGFGRQYAFA